MKQKRMFAVIALCSISMLILAGCQAKKGVTQTRVKYKTQITSIDSYGNAIIGAIEKEKTALQVGDTLTVSFGDNGPTEQLTCKLVVNYDDVPVGEYLARFDNDDGQLKIAINEGSIAEKHQLKEGMTAQIDMAR
ncbi:MAG: hypothetical protein CMJ90_14915 [Planctomycetes bacterium]|nr:hypothetical protein [Planctomycetota bacterium]